RRLPRRAAHAGRRRLADLGQGAGVDGRESMAVGGLQHGCRPARGARLRDPPHRGAGDVRLVDPGHGQRSARASGREAWPMNVLVYLVPIALALGGLGLAAFLWALKSGQFDDLDGAAWRAISDDDLPEKKR